MAEKGYVSRNKEIETNEYTLGFKGADGTNTMRVFAFPVKYKDSDGKLKDITLDITENKEGGFVTKDNAVITTFPVNEEDGIKLEYEDVKISLVPEESYLVTPILDEGKEALEVTDENLFGKEQWINTKLLTPIKEQFIEEEQKEGVLSKDGKTVTYAWQKNTALEYSLTYTGFKEDIVVEEYTGQTEYNFILNTNGLKLTEIGDSYFLTDEEGNIKANIGDVIIFTADEKNNAFGKIECEAIEENQSYKMIIKVDADYLKDEKTVYPIRIDPSIEINYSNNGSGAIQDVTINSSGGSDGTSGSLVIGKRNTYGKSRVLMRFPALDLSSIRSYHLISYAAVEMRDLMCEQEEMAVQCYVFNGSGWTEGAATWGSVSASSYTAGQTTKQVSYAIGAELTPAHRYAFKITGAAQGWKKGTYTQDKGLLFKATDAVENGNTELYKTFASYNRSAYQPSITIQYATTPALTTISSVPYSVSKTMTANYAYSYKFTPTVTGQYSLWTTGNLSTMVYVFNSVAMTNPIASNRGSGHGNNCCITVNLNAGVSYYFVVQGTSRTTAGTFGLKLYRGLPMSGSEKPSYIDKFNSTTTVMRSDLMWPGLDEGMEQAYSVIRLNNCYTYALAAWKHPITKKYMARRGAQPGYFADYTPLLNNAHYSVALAEAEIITRVKADLVALGYSENDIVPCGETEMPPEGFYKVALVIDEYVDYHWYRQVSDANGRWKHKEGEFEVKEIDEGGKLIYNPMRCDRGEYDCFIGFYAVKAYNYNIS